MTSRWLLFVPLAIMALLLGMFLYRVAMPEDSLIESHWIDRPVPSFSLPAATEGVEGLKSSDLADGKVRLVNIFASWCIPCRVEAPQLEALAQSGVVIEGIAIRDQSEDVAMFLAAYGNPFNRIGSDRYSSVQIALGSSGVPETFLIDGQGIVRGQIQGAIMPEQIQDILTRIASMK